MLSCCLPSGPGGHLGFYILHCSRPSCDFGCQLKGRQLFWIDANSDYHVKFRPNHFLEISIERPRAFVTKQDTQTSAG